MVNDLDLLDAELVGFDGMDLVRALPGVLKDTAPIVKDEQDRRAAQRSAQKADEDKERRLAAAIAADARAAQAVAQAAWSAETKQPSASIDASAARQAAAAQIRAATGLSSDARDRRLDAAQRSLGAATTRAQANPTDVRARTLMDAWQQTIDKIDASGYASALSMPPPLERQGIGLGWKIGAGALGGALAVGLLTRLFRR